jgi:phytoene dehydrogenase-like protein
MGGRAFSFNYKGYTMNIGGPRAGLLDGKVDRLISELGQAPGEKGLFEEVVTWRDGSFVRFNDLIPIPEIIKLLEVVRAITPEELPKYDALSAESWIKPLVSDPELLNVVRFNGVVMSTIPWLRDIAASTLIRAIRIGFKNPTTYLAARGYGDFIRILAEATQEKGGVIRTRREVREILIEKGQVRGVTVEERGEEDSGKGRIIKLTAPVVVTAFPVWDLFRIVPEIHFPGDFVRQVNHLHRMTAIFGISAGMREPLFPEKRFIMVDLPRARHPLAAFMASNVAPSLAPEGEHFFEACCQCDFELGKDRVRFQQTIAAMKEDLNEMLPGWEKKALWVRPYFHWEEPARTPGREGIYRPGPQAPGVDGLYLTGDTVNSRSLPGLECAADSAMICAKAILEKLS